MEYAYATLLLAESGEELNERNLRSVLEAGNCPVSESRVKALVAALEGVDVGAVGPENVGELTDGTPTEATTDADDEETPDPADGEKTVEAASDPADGEATTEDIGDESG